MGGSVRRFLAVGTAAVAASAIVGAPASPPRTVQAAPPVTVTKVDLAAAVTPLPAADREQFTSARAALTRLDPVSPLAAVPAPLNAATNSINSVYQWIQGWVDYGVELTQYVLQFIPYGYLIGDQVGIVYYNLVRPISDSVVYDFIDPVVGNPLNPATWVNGAIAVGQTTVRSLINTGIAEFNYFFGWLIPPIPPLPLAAKVTAAETPEVATPDAAVDLKTTAADEKKDVKDAVKDTIVDAVVEKKSTETPKVTEVKTEAAEPSKTDDVTSPTTPSADPKPEPVAKPTVDTKDGVSAQGEVRTGGQTTSPEKTADPADKTDKKDAPPAATTPSETKAPETKTTEESKPEPANTADKTDAKPADAKPAGD
jgi:hypothetical protein